MKKIFWKLIVILIIVTSFLQLNVNAWFVEFWSTLENIEEQSIKSTSSWSFNSEIKTVWDWFFWILKSIANWLLVLFIVYAWVMMAMSMWENEDDIKKWKKSLVYAFMWLALVNIPWVILSALTWKTVSDDVTSAPWKVANNSYIRSIFVNTDVFGDVVWWALDFMQVIVVSVAIIMIIYQWFHLVMSFWKSDSLKEPINKINYSIMALVFIWIMNIWKSVMFKWDFATTWASLVSSLANLALYFTVPTWVVFISYAWYLYITAGGKDDNIKKAKSIFVNTFIGVILLLWIYYFLNDLSKLSF